MSEAAEGGVAPEEVQHHPRGAEEQPARLKVGATEDHAVPLTETQTQENGWIHRTPYVANTNPPVINRLNSTGAKACRQGERCV